MPTEITGGTTDQNGQDFIVHASDRTTEKDSKDLEHTKSIADNWLEDLDPNTISAWEELRNAILNANGSDTAGSIGIAGKSKEKLVYERAILETKLTVEMLGKTLKTVGGRQVEMHVAWAEEMKRLVLEAKLGNGTMYLREVREGLPGIVRDGLPVGEEYESWMGFLDAVKGISGTYIREKMEGTS